MSLHLQLPKIELDFKVSADKKDLTITEIFRDNLVEQTESDSNLTVSIFLGIYFSQIYSIWIPFIATSERTGAALFYKDLDVKRNQLVDYIQKNPTIRGGDIPLKASRYTMPIQDNIDIIRDYDRIVKQKSFLFEENPEYKNFLENWKRFIGGDYLENNGMLSFSSTDGNVPSLPLYITSSAVQSLFLLDVYVRHCAQKHKTLFIDEPELNLNPSRQVTLARLLLDLANFGVKLVITTHSDYIIREINIAMLEKSRKRNKEHLQNLDLSTIHAYRIDEEGLIKELEKDEDGCFSEPLLDSVIDAQNERADSALFGDEDDK
jgi:hypothetical protein